MSAEKVTTVYRNDAELLHIADGERANVGKFLASVYEAHLRATAVDRTPEQRATQALCSGCYMTAIVGLAAELARRSGQSFEELGATLAYEFSEMALAGARYRDIEGVNVINEPEALVVNNAQGDEDHHWIDAEGEEVGPC